MPWILDGNNVARGGSREEVRRLALEVARQQKVSIVVFFDGAPPPGVPAVEKLGAVEVRYAPHADDAIVSFLASGGRGWRVATNDRALIARLRAAGASPSSTDAFLAKTRESGPTGPANSERREGVRSYVEGVEPLADAPVRVRRRRR